MKFIHIADVHLGAVPDSNMPWGNQRGKEIWENFERMISICNDNKADLLLIAGDLFHRQPLLKELKEVNYYFCKLEATQVVIMAGNHDYIGTRSYYQEFEWDRHVHMFLNDKIESIDFPEINTRVYGLSYHKRDISEPLYDDVKPDNINPDNVKTDNIKPDNVKLDNTNPDKQDYIHILLAHGGDEKDIPINRKRLMDAGFDYIALGHIHTPNIFGDKMAYSGSFEPLDKNETGERGYILGEISPGPDRETSISFIPNCIRQYKRINLTVNGETTNGALLDLAKEAVNQNGKQHIYLFHMNGVRDVEIHFDTKALYGVGNVLEVADESVPDYDFDTLYRENADNMIGLFIQRIRESKNQDDVARKALYYGMEALLGARDI